MVAKEQKLDVRTLLIGLAALRREEAHHRRAEAEALRARAERGRQPWSAWCRGFSIPGKGA